MLNEKESQKIPTEKQHLQPSDPDQLGHIETPDEEVQVPDAPLSPEEQEGLKRRKLTLMVVILLVLSAAGGAWYIHGQTYEETDDAQVDGHLAAISSRIAGTVTAVYAQDNDHIEVGQPLVSLDPRSQAVELEQARAQYEQAVFQLHAQQPNVAITQNNNRADVSSDDAQLAQARAAVSGAESDRAQAAAKIADAQAQVARDLAQYRRYKTLYEKKEASREEYERYEAASASSGAMLDAAQAALASASQTVDQRNAQLAAQRSKRAQDQANAPQMLRIRAADTETQRANADAAKAALDRASLDLSFTKVLAPISGIVTLRSVEIGTHATEGSQLMMIVQTDDLWLTANFKETQLRHMKPGQGVRIHIDALDKDFDGYVQSMPAVTGSRSSVLPPENATGNYVKVVQRLPIRIRFKSGQNGMNDLRPGMSAEPHVYLR